MRAVKRARACVALPCAALRAPARWLPAARRGLATEGGGGGGDRVAVTPEQASQVHKAASDITANVRAGVAELQRTYGERNAEKLWMLEYYRRRQHAFWLPALLLSSGDEAVAGMPSLAAKSVVFLSHALRDVPSAEQLRYAGTAALVQGVDAGLLMSALHLAGTPEAKSIFDRLAASIRRAGNQNLVAAGQLIASVPRTPVDVWTFPWDERDVATRWNAPRTPPFPWEVHPLFASAREVLGFHDWLLLSSTSVLEALWGAFYATGDTRYVSRVCEMASPWAEFSHLPNAANLILDVSEPLPEDVTAKSDVPAEAIRSVKAQVSRIALWSLLQHSRRHQLVFEAVCGSVASLAEFMVEPRARDAAKAARVPDAEARARTAVLPSLLHLIARARLDTPFEGEADLTLAPAAPPKAT